MILKPRSAPEFRRRFHRQVLEARNLEELRRLWEPAAPYRPQLSEVIPGGDELIWTLAIRHLSASPREIARGQLSARAFIASVRPPIRDGVLDVRDPRPAIVLARRHLRRLRRR